MTNGPHTAPRRDTPIPLATLALVCALFASGCVGGPLVMTEDDGPGLDAAKCERAAKLMQFATRSDSPDHARMGETLQYWTARHESVTPHAFRRQMHQNLAGELMKGHGRIGGRVDIFYMGIVLGQCRDLRARLEGHAPSTSEG